MPRRHRVLWFSVNLIRLLQLFSSLSFLMDLHIVQMNKFFENGELDADSSFWSRKNFFAADKSSEFILTYICWIGTHSG